MTITGTATVNFEGTEDGSTYFAIGAPQSGQIVTSTTASGLFDLNVTNLQTIRARISGYSSGSVTVTGHTGPLTQITHTTQTGGTVASGATDSGNPVRVGGVYHASNQTFTDEQRADAQMTVNGFIREDLGTLIAGEDLTNNRLDVEQHFGYSTEITANTTTTVKSGAGFLHTVYINQKGASSNTATLYDNTAGSGTVIATIDTTANVGSIVYDVAFSTGLTIVTATGTAPHLGVSYR